MNITSTIATIALLASTALANSNNLDYANASSKTKAISINIINLNQESKLGELIEADESYFYFLDAIDNNAELVPRNQIQILETNMDVNLFSLLKGKDPTELTDVIELNDGTRIPGIILDISTKEIQYFTGKSLKREIMPASSIYMLYMDEGTISIPFPVAEPSYTVL